MVFPKSSLIVLTTMSGGRVVNAGKIKTRKRAMKAFSLNFEVSTITAIILIKTSNDFIKILIDE
jgi:hypothetical protein